MYSNYTNTDNQIQYMDYSGLVQLLTTGISPETRSVVLAKLTQMNNQLLNQMQTQFQTQFQTQLDLSRPMSMSSKRKGATELQHPSMEQNLNSRHINPIPRQEFKPHQTNFSNRPVDEKVRSVPFSNPVPSSKSKSIPIPPKKNLDLDSDSELDIDDILRDINGSNSAESDLDQKLKQLTNLKQKILTDKQKRKMDRTRYK